MQNPEIIETSFEDQSQFQSQVQTRAEEQGSSWGSYYQNLFKTAPKKEKEDLSYKERHAVRHLRHRRDEEYNKLAFKACHDFTENYSTCLAGNELSAPWACRKPLQELKACVNRTLLRFREEQGEIDSLPIAPNQHVDYEQILNEHYAKNPPNTQP
jgi:hypothetical protein